MRLLTLIPANTKIDFVGKRQFAFGFSIILILLSIGTFLVQGLNLGIDFRGGVLIEVETNGPADIEKLRDVLGNLGLVSTTRGEESVFGATVAQLKAPILMLKVTTKFLILPNITFRL